MSSSVNIKYPSKQTVRGITSKCSILGFRGGQQRCSCSSRVRNSCTSPVLPICSSPELPSLLLCFKPQPDKGWQLALTELPHFVFIPVQKEGKSSETFWWCGDACCEPKRGQKLAGEAGFGAAGSIMRLALVCLHPHPWVILGKAERKWSSGCQKFQSRAVILRGSSSSSLQEMINIWEICPMNFLLALHWFFQLMGPELPHEGN